MFRINRDRDTIRQQNEKVNQDSGCHAGFRAL